MITEGPTLINTSIATDEEEAESKDLSTEFKSTSVEMSSEYWSESVKVDVGFEKSSDTVDFSGSAEIKYVDVGSEIFGENVIISVDCSTSHEPKSESEDRCSEFICQMIDCTSSSEVTFMDLGNEYDVNAEITSKTVNTSCESSLTLIETGMEAYVKRKIVEGSSCFEMSHVTVDCDTSEVVEEIMAEAEDQEQAAVIRLEDESVCGAMVMTDIGTVVECRVVDASEEMAIKNVEFSGEWKQETKVEDAVFETEKSGMVNVSVSSAVEYCTVEIEFDERNLRTKEATVDSCCAYEVSLFLTASLILTKSIKNNIFGSYKIILLNPVSHLNIFSNDDTKILFFFVILYF